MDLEIGHHCLPMQMSLPEYERTSIRYGDSQPSNTARYLNLSALLDPFR